jgi:hypothetical protein
VILEFQKRLTLIFLTAKQKISNKFILIKLRSKLLKQQERIQFDIVKEINAKIENLNEKKTAAQSNYEKYLEKQNKISERFL